MDLDTLLEMNRTAKRNTEALLDACAVYFAHLKERDEPIPEGLAMLIRPDAVNWVLVHAWIKGHVPDFAAKFNRGPALF